MIKISQKVLNPVEISSRLVRELLYLSGFRKSKEDKWKKMTFYGDIGVTSTKAACKDQSYLLMLALSQHWYPMMQHFFARNLLSSCLSSLENQSLIKLNDTPITWTAAKHKNIVMKITWKSLLRAHGISLFTN